MRSTMTQERLTDLAVLSIESELARAVDFKDIINDFANMKARKVLFRALQTFIFVILFYKNKWNDVLYSWIPFLHNLLAIFSNIIPEKGVSLIFQETEGRGNRTRFGGKLPNPQTGPYLINYFRAWAGSRRHWWLLYNKHKITRKDIMYNIVPCAPWANVLSLHHTKQPPLYVRGHPNATHIQNVALPRRVFPRFLYNV